MELECQNHAGIVSGSRAADNHTTNQFIDDNKHRNAEQIGSNSVELRSCIKRKHSEKKNVFLGKEKTTPYRCPLIDSIVLFSKRKGKLWLIIDSRQLNKQINKSS